MPRVSRKTTRRGGGPRRRGTRRRTMKGGANYIPWTGSRPISEDLFVQPPPREMIKPEIFLNSDLSSLNDKPIKQNDYNFDLAYLDKRITFEVGSELIHIRQDIKNLSNEIKELKKENNKLKEILISLGVD
tara:strand:+ start:118 stop:510 length:393 start_codon:yes stop_codon:yes gene_type:complete